MGSGTANLKFFRRWGVMSFLVMACGVPAWGAQAPFDRIVVFGTSLSDPGNYFALHPVNNTPPYTSYVDANLVPGAAYAIGGHHLSNGSTWIEQLALPLGLEGSVGAAFANSGGATNYAVDAARAYNDGINVDLQEQVGRFTQDVAGVAPPGALYVMEMGSNDVRDALQLALSGGNGGAILAQSLNSIGTELFVLYGMGARHFLIWNVPDISKTPTVQILAGIFPNIDVVGQVSGATQEFNVALGAIVSAFASLPGADVKVLDAFHTVDTIVADPGAFGLTDVTHACIMPGEAPFQCQHPDRFLFWDGIHPTKAGHAITAHQAAIVLGL